VSRTLTLLQRNLLHSFNRACFMIWELYIW
jgi:hypothetical protein